MKRDGLDERARGIKEITASETPSTTSIVPPKDPDQIQQKTALTSITFNLINNIVLHYDVSFSVHFKNNISIFSAIILLPQFKNAARKSSSVLNRQ